MAGRTEVIITLQKVSRSLLAQKQQGPMRTMNLGDLEKKRQVRKRLHFKPVFLFLVHRKQRLGLHEVTGQPAERQTGRGMPGSPSVV